VAHVLVVGAGLAGARVVTLLRAAGFAGRITLVGAEAEPPYDRPPLTKEPGAAVDLRTAMGIDVWAAADAVRLGTAATGLQRTEARLGVTLASGSPQADAADPSAAAGVDADAVVVASGASPVVPTGWAGPGVHVLHTRGDAGAFWPVVGPGARIVVVGGGWIGCEAATTAAARGAQVTLLEAGGRLLADRVPPQVGDWLAARLAEAGVVVRLGEPVAGVEPALGVPGSVPRVQAGADLLPADQVLVALGVRPATDWLAGSAVPRDATGAVLVDPWGRSSVTGVLAVGDAAARWSPRAGRHLPGGHWDAAMRHPEALVPALMGWLGRPRQERRAAWAAPLAQPAPDPVPYVFSALPGGQLQAVGELSGTTVDWQSDERGFTAAVLDGTGQLVGLCALGHPRAISRARRELAARGAAPADLAGVGG
jgi:NADPH-dependent 2,4-dienoyl-CoA reductase/sulfur reductase-like enzyme